MQTIHAGNMKKSAFIRSQLEACKVGKKVKKIFSKKSFSTSIFEVLSNLYRLSLSQMAGCKRCALKRGKNKGKKKGKEKEKGGKNGDQNRLFFFFFFFYKSVRMFFHMRSGHFSNMQGKLYLDLVNHICYCLRSKF